MILSLSFLHIYADFVQSLCCAIKYLFFKSLIHQNQIRKYLITSFAKIYQINYYMILLFPAL